MLVTAHYANGVTGHLLFGVVLLAIVGTVGVFLFPCALGPYPATHGPVTATLRSKIAPRGVEVTTSGSSGSSQPIWVVSELSRMMMATCLQLSRRISPRENTPVLRC
jgi:hypothetical protein